MLRPSNAAGDNKIKLVAKDGITSDNAINMQSIDTTYNRMDKYSSNYRFNQIVRISM